MLTIEFIYNWNGKLYNNWFTTFRMLNPSKYKLGHTYLIVLKKGGVIVEKFEAILQDIYQCKLDSLPMILPELDAGYPRGPFKNLIETMYKNKPINIYEKDWAFYLFERVVKLKY
ncbi:MAG: hypothetical protein R2759_00020 [Bacteroidales bacterium]